MHTLAVILTTLALMSGASGTFTNPILHSDYSDPDVVCVDGEFWMTASSFNCVPGLQILHSYDLLNWEIVGAALPRLEFEKPSAFDRAAHGNGVWAPSIRHHDGRFYIFWGDPDRGIYQVNATDPRGEWSKPVLVIGGKGLIDPCPLWDDDGRVYLVHGWAGSRAGFKSVLSICELDAQCTRCISGQVMVFDGNRNGNKTVEGPKIYKRNGSYYIFAPAGGVKEGWQLVMRSKDIYGPYEWRKVMHQGETATNGPHQGGWVDDAEGKSWFMHFQDRGPWGRVVHLQPMSWDREGWCVIGADLNGDGIGEPVDVAEKPAPYLPARHISGISALETRTDFSTATLPLNWQWHANPQIDWYMACPAEECIRLNCVCQDKDWRNLWHTPNLLLEKIVGPEMELTALMSFRPGYEGDRVGIVVMGQDYSTIELDFDGSEVTLARRSCEEVSQVNPETLDAHASFAADKSIKGNLSRLGQSLHNTIYTKQPSRASMAKARQRQENAEKRDLADEMYDVFLRVSVDRECRCTFSYSYDGKKFRPLGNSFTAREGRWIGAKIGFFAIAQTRRNDGGYVYVY